MMKRMKTTWTIQNTFRDAEEKYAETKEIHVFREKVDL